MRKRTTYVTAVSVWALSALFASASLFCQQFTFHQYGTPEGLSNLAINCLMQDHTGYIWTGTDDGLFKYDGDRFQYFGHAEGFRNTEIHGVAESSQGVLWVAAEDGISRRLGNRFEPVDIGAKGQTRSIAFDHSGQVYIEHVSGIIQGILTAGSYRFRTIVHGTITGIVLDGDNIIFAKDGDLWRFSGSRIERIGSPAGLPLDRWGAVIIDSVGNLWVRSPTRLYELVKGQPRFLDRSTGVSPSPDSRLYADAHERLFVSVAHGILVLEGVGQIQKIDSAHGLPADVVGPVLFDRENSLWLGTVGGGLVRGLGHGEWLSWKREDGLLHNSVWAIRNSSSGRTWVGTSGGLNILDPSGKVIRSWTSRNGLAADRVLAIAQAPSGHFFIGTDPLGISQFNERGDLLKTYGASSGIRGRINALAIDTQGRLWSVGYGGCFRSVTPVGSQLELKFAPVEIPDIPAQTFLRDILIDSGDVWIATSQGLARLEAGHWRIFSERDGLKAADIGTITKKQGTLWIAYRDALGISRLDFKGETPVIADFAKQDGLPSDLVYALAFDIAGRLWVTTDNGIAVLEQGNWHRYGREDGLVWNDGNSRALNTDRTGNIWVGTSGGLSRYTPTHSVSESSPQVVLTAIESASQKWEAEDHPILQYAHRSLLIRFSSLSYQSETSTRFRYRLLGYENAWTETTERSVYFAALPAGNYVFEVAGSGPNSLWSSLPARFSFTIKTPWWQSWWIIACYVILSLILASLLWRHRVRLLIQQKQYLEQQVSDRTAELSESHRRLEEIAYLDILTSLPNRRRFTEEIQTRLAIANRYRSPLALLLIDLDHFKAINDTFGHDAGDAVLVEAAFRLKFAVRNSDFVARLGGDEFAILVAATDKTNEIEAVCKRILDVLSASVPFKGEALTVGCSVGVAIFPDDGETQDALYKTGDLALYEAKGRGRNSFSRRRAQAGEERRTRSSSGSGPPCQLAP
jgi:diguanylate cyclase (GGDEF)-like protein